MGRLFYLLVLVVDVLVIVDILKSKKDMEKKALWIIVVIFLPFSVRFILCDWKKMTEVQR